MCIRDSFYRNEDLSTTCQCRQHKLNPLSTQINIYCVMTNHTPALLVHRAPWARAAVMLLLSPSIFLALLPLELMYNLRRPPPRYIWKWRWPQLTLRRAISRRSHEKNGGLWTAYKIYGLFRNASNRTHPLLMAWRFIGYCFSKPLTAGPYCMIDDFANSEVMATNCIKVSSSVY